MLFESDDEKRGSVHCREAKKGKLNIQKLTQLHNLKSLMTMCPSILASICALSLWRESGKLRGHKCAQSVPCTVCRARCAEIGVQCAQCRARVAIKGHLVRHIEEEQLSVLISTGSAELIGRSCESYQCVRTYTPRLPDNGRQMLLIRLSSTQMLLASTVVLGADMLLTAL